MVVSRRKPRGPKSFRDEARRPKYAGRKMRGQLRFNENRSSEAMQSYRCGYTVMWSHAAAYMEKKKLPRPGQFKKRNQHGGMLWATGNECKMTGPQAARVLELCYEARISEAQLRQVRKSLSYAHFLRTGKVSRNWEEVTNTWDTFGDFGEVVRPTLPEHIPTPEQLKHAFMKPWCQASGMPLTIWSVGLLACWDSSVAGLRSNADMNKVKKSVCHDHNKVEGYCSTSFVEGRSKLCGRKRGSRPWRVWRCCLCPNGKHIPVPEDLEVSKEGFPVKEPSWCTNCPTAAFELVMALQRGPEKRCYPRWLKSGSFRKQNVGDPVGLANRWFDAQEVERQQDFSRNAGRKCLARWLSKVKAAYEEGFEIHGDLFAVWSQSYQPDVENRTGFDRRTQSTSPDHCLRAYKKLRKFFGVKVPNTTPLNRQERLMLLVANKLGVGEQALRIAEEE